MNCGMRRRYLRLLSMLICPLLVVETGFAGQSGGGISILVLEGNKAQNLLSQKTPKPISVRVVDRTGKPLSGASVLFVPPEFGPGGTFVTDQSPVTVNTNDHFRKKKAPSKKLMIISAVIGGGVVAAFAAKGGGGGSNTPTQPTGATVAPTISFLNASVGAPQ